MWLLSEKKWRNNKSKTARLNDDETIERVLTLLFVGNYEIKSLKKRTCHYV